MSEEASKALHGPRPNAHASTNLRRLWLLEPRPEHRPEASEALESAPGQRAPSALIFGLSLRLRVRGLLAASTLRQSSTFRVCSCYIMYA